MIRYETSNWPSSRRCGLRFYSFDWGEAAQDGGYDIGTTMGDYRSVDSDYSYLAVNCSLRAGPVMGNDYSTVCDCVNYRDSNVYLSFARTRTCPKGWGRNRDLYPGDNYSVQNAQGYVKDSQIPVYGYVTRYRTAYYNYITARVSKA